MQENVQNYQKRILSLYFVSRLVEQSEISYISYCEVPVTWQCQLTDLCVLADLPKESSVEH